MKNLEFLCTVQITVCHCPDLFLILSAGLIIKSHGPETLPLLLFDRIQGILKDPCCALSCTKLPSRLLKDLRVALSCAYLTAGKNSIKIFLYTCSFNAASACMRSVEVATTIFTPCF